MNGSLIVHPFAGLGNLSLGAQRSACRAQLGPGWREFSRSGASDFKETDAYAELGLYLEYDSREHLQFIEAAAPATVVYNDVTLLGRSLDDVVADLERVGVHAVTDDEGVRFPDEGLVLYAPDGRVEAASVYRRGYYDDEA